MLVVSNCSCCMGYVIQCNNCKKTTTKCSNASMEEAIEIGQKKGWKVMFPRLGKPGLWLCPQCQNGEYYTV